MRATNSRIVAGTIAAGLASCLLAACATAPSLADRAVPPRTPDLEGRLAEGDATPTPGLPSRESMRRRDRLEDVDLGPARTAAEEAVDDAFDRAGERTVGWWGRLPDSTPWRRLLRDDRELAGSISTGTTSNGRVHGAVELSEVGPHHSIIERHRDRRTQWGTEELVDLVREAAEDVADEHPGSTLRVGNLGYRGGGDIPWSSSHNSGRDVDLAFYCERADTGEPVPAPGLLEFRPDGRAVDRPELAFDIERNWELVESLLTSPRVGMQWIFISRALKRKLLRHARETDAPKHLVRRAAELLHQPSDAPPHADHFHVRITCPRQDRLEGCLNYGPRWDWVDWHRRDLLARSLELAEALRTDDPSTQMRALDFLRRIRSPYAPEVALTAGIRAESPRVRREALDLATDVAWWSPTAVERAISLIEREETRLAAKASLYEILRRTHSRRTRRFALSRLLGDGVTAAEKVHAARALSHVLEPGLVPVLIDALGEQQPRVRAETARLLRRLTGHRQLKSWSGISQPTAERGIRRWRAWWDAHWNESRATWLRRSFAEHGYSADTVFERKSVGELIDLLPDSPEYVAYNAHRALHRITGRWIPYEGWSFERLHGYWKSWWETERNRRVARGP